MAKNRTPIVKLSRRLGIPVGKEHYVRRRPYPPGIHGPKYARRRPRLSAYAEQLLEKQKAKAIYGVMERQFRNYFEKAARHPDNTSEVLVRQLELRLDNIVYRLGFAKTRRQARQMVNHRFFLVNGNSVDIPSYTVSVGDEISIKESKKNSKMIQAIGDVLKLNPMPKWLTRDEKAVSGKVTSAPEGDDLDQPFDPTFIVEYYSR
jgi:small subunit ribosomal protein S4